MPTDNPKISLYVPQQIYDCFREFQQEQGLSMSQAGIVILAEYFGLKETIKEITKGTTVGGVTLAEFESLKSKVLKLEERINLQVTTGGLPAKEEKIVLEDNDNSRLEFLSSPITFEPIPAIHLSKKRFGLSTSTMATYKRTHTLEELTAWTKDKDPDDIAWIISSDNKGYIPQGKLPSELLSKLQKWVTKNI